MECPSRHPTAGRARTPAAPPVQRAARAFLAQVWPPFHPPPPYSAQNAVFRPISAPVDNSKRRQDLFFGIIFLCFGNLFWYNILMLRQSFTDFIFATNTDGSGKAASYVRALDMLGPILTKHYPKPIVGGSMWRKFSLADIRAIHEWICAESRKGSASFIYSDFESPSYLKNNFCSAAVRAYGEFLATEAFENGILAKVSGETGGKAVAQKAEALIDATSPTDLEAHLNLTAKEGKMKLAAVKVRVNQDIFRKMVLQNYSSKCCITGLSVPDVLRASHINPWSEDEKNRLNTENGLCLSAACFVDLKKFIVIRTMWRTVENVAA